MLFRLITTGFGVLFCLCVWIWFTHGQPNDAIPSKPPETKSKHPVHIRTPKGPPTVKTAHADANGIVAEVRCNTCHANRTPNPSAQAGADLKDFHQGLKVQHGQVTCLSCHHADDYESLRLADGRKIGFPQVIDLCSQCHGPQARDYAHGAHGGMNGYWDLSRGPRQRNTCTDCHDPHSPAFPKVRPVFAPKDRFPPRIAKEAHE